jgi:hypothetical protein
LVATTPEVAPAALSEAALVGCVALMVYPE